MTRNMVNLTWGQAPCETKCTIGSVLSSRVWLRNLLCTRLVVTLLLLMVVGVSGVKAQTAPVEITTADDITNDTKKLYLIQTNQFQSFYMIPKDNKVTTVNLPNDQMLWYFEDAGTVVENEKDVQYYYIVSNRNDTKKYICNTSARSIDLVVKDASNDEKCKFKLVEDDTNGTEGFYNIDAKTPQSSGNYALNKQAGSVSSIYPIRTTSNTYVHDYSSKWKFIRFNGTFNFPDPLSPFALSTNVEKHFFKIRNKQNTAFYMSTNSSNPQMVTYANTGNDGMVWYFKEAGSDGWFKYYYIINQEADDQYMYYEGTTGGSGMTENAVSLKAKSSGNEDHYQFVIVQAAKVDKSNGEKPLECYTIIPKLLKGILWDSNSLGSSSIENDNTMGIIEGRVTTLTDDNNSHWTFEPIDPCADPTITFDETKTTENVTLTNTTTGSSIYYTTTGENPTRASTLYEGEITLTANTSTTIKAVTVKDGNARSNVVTKTFIYMPTITLAGGPYIYDGDAKTPSISVMVGETPVSADDYDVSYENNTNAGTATVTIREKTGNETIIYGTTTFTIDKASITPTVSITGWTYGTPNDPSVSGNTGNGSVTYKYKVKGADDETYTEDKPENAGTYLVKAIIAESTNYNGATTEPVEFTISKADFNPIVSITGWAYGGTANSPSVSGVPGGVTVTYLYKVQGADDDTYSEDVPTNVGTYTVQATIAETDNYHGKTATADFTISKADLSATVSITGWTFGSYDVTTNSPSVTGNLGGGSVTYKYKAQGADDDTYSEDVPTDAGNYTVQATIAETDNYNDKVITTDFTISKASLSATVSLDGWTYGETAATPSVTGNTEDGAVTYTYKVKDSSDDTYSETQPSDAGDYTIKASIAATTNYDAASVTTDFTISKASLSATVSLDGWTYGETAATPSVTGNTEDGAVTYTYKVRDSSDDTYSETQPSDAGDYTIKASIAATTNYNAASATTDFTISKASLSATVSIDGWTYGETAATPSVTGNTENGAVTYTYKASGDDAYTETVPTNVGDYTIKASIATTTNYLASEATADFTITAKNLNDGDDPAENITVEITEANPEHVIVKQGETPLRVGTEGSDYDYTISTTGSATTKYYEVTITGANNYEGSFKAKFANVTFGTKNNNYYWGTFVSNDEDGDFAVPSNMEAYIVTGINASASTVEVEQLDNIPEQEPVLLLTNKDAHGFVVKAKTDGADPTGTNLLKVDATDKSVATAEIYVLYKGEFVLSAAGTLPAGKIYLQKPGGVTPAPAILTIDWGATTGIDNSQHTTPSAQHPDTWYTLEGIKLNGKPAKKGLYLMNGKKTIVK